MPKQLKIIARSVSGKPIHLFQSQTNWNHSNSETISHQIPTIINTNCCFTANHYLELANSQISITYRTIHKRSNSNSKYNASVWTASTGTVDTAADSTAMNAAIITVLIHWVECELRDMEIELSFLIPEVWKNRVRIAKVEIDQSLSYPEGWEGDGDRWDWAGGAIADRAEQW